MRWKIFTVLLAVYEGILYPYQLAVVIGGLQGDDLKYFRALEIVVMLVFLLDLIIKLRTTYSDANSLEIVDGKMIAMQYIKHGSFIIDVIAWLPIPEIALIMLESENYYFKLYYIVRLIRIARVRSLHHNVSNETHLTLLGIMTKTIYFVLLVI